MPNSERSAASKTLRPRADTTSSSMSVFMALLACVRKRQRACSQAPSWQKSESHKPCAKVLCGPFKYGPQSTLAQGLWDSDFYQLGAWEHARWRFLTQARSAMNTDIDELVVSARGRSVFEAAERSLFGIARYA